MICLCCGKEIKENAEKAERENQWHQRCVRKFFGTNELPELVIDKNQLEELAVQTVHKGLTVPGVQKKLSLHLSQDNDKKRLTVVDYPTGYILKPQADEFPSLPEFEYTAMQLAGIAGIKTVPFALIRTADGLAYITKRIDRDITNRKNNRYGKNGKVKNENADQTDDLHEINTVLYAMEDFCQLGMRLTQDKYRGSYEQCAKIVKRYSTAPMLDLSEIFIRVVFSYIIGNSDMHLKNFSLIETAPGSREYHLSAAYDLLPVNLVMPEDKEELALPLNGKKQNIRKKDFIVFAEKCGISANSAKKIIAKLCSQEGKYTESVRNSMLSENEKEEFCLLIGKRIENLSR